MSEGTSPFSLCRAAASACAAALAALSITTCESATSPGSGGSGASGPIQVGVAVTSDLTGSDSIRTYTFDVAKDSIYVLFGSVETGTVSWLLSESGAPSLDRFGTASAGTTPLLDNALAQFQPPASGTLSLVVRATPPAAGARFSIEVFQVKPAPESATAFAIGDTVHGEAIEPVGDVDVFKTALDSGQDIVASAEAPTASGLGPLLLVVTDPSGATVNRSYYVTGAPASQISGRIHATAGGTYRFAFQGPSTFLGGPVSPFHGPYRFWTWAVNRAPEHLPTAIQPGVVVAGESVDKAGDVDEFRFTDTAGAVVNVFYQSLVPSHLDLVRPGGAIVATVPSGSDTSLYAAFAGRLVLPSSGAYTVRVSSDGYLLSDTGAYRLFVYPIDPRPEHVPAAITPGDTVSGESIDLPGDLDEFTFTAAPGQGYYAFLQARSGSAATQLELDVVDSTNAVLGAVTSTGTDTTLRLQMTPRITVATSRTLRLRVYGANAPSAGPYRLLLYAVNPKPESHPDTLAAGDSVAGESLDFPGDVDQYRVHIASPANLNVILSWQGYQRLGTTFGVSITDSSSGASVGAASVFTDAAGFATGGFAVQPGTYLVRVAADGFDGRPAAWGPYKLWLAGYSTRPESTPDTIAIGDTIAGESINVPGDVDTYHFYGLRGQHLNFMLQGQAPATDSGTFGLSLRPPGALYPMVYLQSPASDVALTDHQTFRYDLPATGWYAVTLTGGRPLPVPVAPLGPYRFAVVLTDSMPETHAPTLAIGDSVANEAINYPGDWDRFTLTATPGQLAYFQFGTSPSVPCCDYYPIYVALDPATGDTLAHDVGQFYRVTSTFVVPASGSVAIEVFEYPHVLTSFGDRECYDATCGGVYQFTGPYLLHPLAMDSTPETASSTYTLGDTVTTEAISPAGDVDQFTLTATPGDTLRAWLRLRAAPVPSGGGISMEVFDAATATELIGSGAMITASLPGFISWGQFIVPSSGRLVIRLRGTGTDGWDATTAPYAFFIRRGT